MSRTRRMQTSADSPKPGVRQEEVEQDRVRFWRIRNRPAPDSGKFLDRLQIARDCRRLSDHMVTTGLFRSVWGRNSQTPSGLIAAIRRSQLTVLKSGSIAWYAIAFHPVCRIRTSPNRLRKPNLGANPLAGVVVDEGL